MERREFLKTTGLFAGLPIVSMFQSAIAQAHINESKWKDIKATKGLVKFQVLWSDLPDVAAESIDDLSVVIGASAIIYRFAPNFPQRGHWHTKGEYAYIIRGWASNGNVVKHAGEDSYMPPGSYHPTGTVGPEGVDVFVFTPAPVDFAKPAPQNIDLSTDDETTG